MSDRTQRHVYRAVLPESWRSLPRRPPELPSDHPLRRAGYSAGRCIPEPGHIGPRAKLAPSGRTGCASQTRLTLTNSYKLPTPAPAARRPGTEQASRLARQSHDHLQGQTSACPAIPAEPVLVTPSCRGLAAAGPVPHRALRDEPTEL